MFPDLQLASVYYSQSGDVAERFFIPVLRHAVSYDRVSAYFSAKSLAAYAEGLEFFGKAGHCFRLILSRDISKEDYDEIKKGYAVKKTLTDEMISDLRQNLSLSEEKNISNLAYLISIGVVDIKIAFKTKGIFHDKCGILSDADGNKICFRGSNNETDAAISRNYEAFNISCSWLDCNGFYSEGIRNCEKEFQLLWDNKKEGLSVVPAETTVVREILKYNKGKIIVEEAFLDENAIILDYDKELKLWMNECNRSWFLKSSIYKISLKSKIKKEENGVFFFLDGLSYIDFKKIEQKIERSAVSSNRIFLTTQRYKDYILAKDIYIDKRMMLGTELKQDMDRYKEKYEDFLKVLDSHMSRKLREKQAKDAFFMLAMQKAGNFSVPGSGKTSSVLAVYCYLKYKKLVDRILVIGPKNCFKSWRDEFNKCFEGKEALTEFNIQSVRQTSDVSDIKVALKYNYSRYNLMLFNYEILSSYEKEIVNLVKNRTLLVFDEVHRIKKIGGDRAATALNIAKDSNYTIALTGTPIPNSYKDIYNFLNILFPDEYRDFFNFNSAMLDNPSDDDVEIINKRLQPFFCRTTKEQLLVPPANEDIIESCEANEDEQAVFEILCKKFRNNKFALIIRLLQLESNPSLLLKKINLSVFSEVLDTDCDIDDIDFVDYSEEMKKRIENIALTSKKRACIECVKSLVHEKKKIIVWCIFQDSINSLNEQLKEIGISSDVIYGDVGHLERENILNRFKKGEFDVLLTNPHTLAESVSLHDVCHDAVYYEYSYNLVHLLQSKDRIHRLGLPANQYTQYYFIQCWFKKQLHPFSLDDVIYKRLVEKEQIMLNAIDNNVLERMTTPEEDAELIFKDLFS